MVWTIGNARGFTVGVCMLAAQAQGADNSKWMRECSAWIQKKSCVGQTVEPQCHITENFGKVRKRTVAFDRVIGAWRPERK